MLQLGRDPEQRKCLGANGRDWIRANLLPEVLASEVRSVIEGVIATRKYLDCTIPAFRQASQPLPPLRGPGDLPQA
jgi:hypothetical protein